MVMGRVLKYLTSEWKKTELKRKKRGEWERVVVAFLHHHREAIRDWLDWKLLFSIA